MEFYQVDSFVDPLLPFTGNPAIVYLIDDDKFPPNMVQLAEAHNAPATTFVLMQSEQMIQRKQPKLEDKRRKSPLHIRWFLASGVELPLCGHGTLAAAYIIYEKRRTDDPNLIFITNEGTLLTVSRSTGNGKLEITFPANLSYEKTDDAALYSRCKSGLRAEKEGSIAEMYTLDGHTTRPKLLIVFDKAFDVESLRPDFAEMAKWNEFGVVVTAPADLVEKEGVYFHFISRYFAPKAGINEDIATGSIQCALFPFWDERLPSVSKGFQHALRSRQCSSRQGFFMGVVHPADGMASRVTVGGYARIFAEGKMVCPDTTKI
jgi:PhzF family phenazine biosynthesis protein